MSVDFHSVEYCVDDLGLVFLSIAVNEDQVKGQVKLFVFLVWSVQNNREIVYHDHGSCLASDHVELVELQLVRDTDVLNIEDH